MSRLLTVALFAGISLAATTIARASEEIEILQPFTDEMAEELGMTPLEELNTFRPVTRPTEDSLRRHLNENKVVVVVNKAASGPGAQSLVLYENGTESMRIKVSTGKEEQVRSTSGRVYVSTTPRGHWRPTKVYKDYLSYTWDAPMPNAVFYVGGIAIHATGQSNYSKLGTRASGGCVRTTLEDSKKIREIVMDSGRGSAPGMYVMRNESRGRNIVTGNTVSVPAVSLQTGLRTGQMVQSWDTLIIVHE